MKKAIIVGASSGIGKELAQILVKEGYSVGITGRRLDKLDELKSQNPDRYIISNFDVRETEGAIAALEMLATELGRLDLLIISSGTGDINPNLDFETEKNTIDTNVTGFTCIADWTFNYFMKQGHGQLAAITSLGGLRGSAEAPAYNASKAFQINYLEGLRQKAAKAKLPVPITDIRPGLVDTAMAKGEGLFWVMPVEKVSRQIYRAITKKKRVATVTRRWRIVAVVLKLMPRSIYERM
ncbi:MAG: SDR family NAD(P)-dependent oxidoreductase [Bacteroidales bacterium]|nr:SDR family NAD(P)-dependent oxidoreductase [Bacteroidales bacterium]